MTRYLLPIMALILLGSCSSAYYGAMEQFGVHKRDILVNRVEEARDSQEEAKQQFSSALEQFNALLNFDGGDLRDIYSRLNTEFEESEERAQQVQDRIRAVETVSEDLFDEWQEELSLYTNQDLRRASEQSLEETQRRYQQLINAMHNAEAKMTPVIDAFRDHVLFLKHNLNSRAVTSLRSELVNIESDIGQLIQDMEVSIAESNSFLSNLESMN